MIALARHLADSTAFALIVGLLCFCMPRRGPAARHTLWLIAAAKFLLPLAFFSWLGESLREFLPRARVSAEVPRVLSRWVIPPAVLQPHDAIATSWSHLLIVIWVTGTVLALGLWFSKLWASQVAPGGLGEPEKVAFSRLKKRVDVSRDVQLSFSNTVPEPALTGFWKPTVLIPVGLVRELSGAELESVILHELAHAKRWDNWAAAFAHAVTCIFWFYPLLWWIEKRLRRERELACDEMVIRCGAAPDDYLVGILKVCRFHLSEAVPGISGVCGSNLKARMEAIMSVSSEGRFLRAPRVLVGGLIGVIVGIPLAIGLATASNARAYPADQNGRQSAKESKAQEPITCASGSVRYPEGTVIQIGGGPERMCARVLDPANPKDPEAPPTFHPQWIRTNKVIRERSATVLHLPEPPPVSCKPAPPTGGDLCMCEGEGQFSPGAFVNSATGPFVLHCEHGTWAQTKTPNVERK
jgi:bla regulator protein blaR1